MIKSKREDEDYFIITFQGNKTDFLFFFSKLLLELVHKRFEEKMQK